MNYARAILLFAALCTAGCSARNAGDRVRHMSRTTHGDLVVIDTWNYADGAGIGDRPARTPGAAMLRDAVAADDGVAAFIRGHGMPDAVEFDPSVREVSLAYAANRTAYTLGPGAMPAILPGGLAGSAVRRERPLTDAEVSRVASQPRLDREVAAVRRFLELHTRTDRVFARLARAVPSPPAARDGGRWCGFALVPATPVTARALGQPDAFAGAFVSSVDAGGPATGRLAVGDRLEAPVECREGTLTFDVTRAGVVRHVTVASTPWPVPLRLALLPGQGFLLRSGPSAVAVTDELLEVLPADDEFAWALAHEMAHHALGHVPAGDGAATLLMALPGTGDLTDVALAAAHSAFTAAQEQDADALGARYAAAAGFDPAAGARALAALMAKYSPGRLEDLLDAEPPTASRVDALRAVATTLPRRAR